MTNQKRLADANDFKVGRRGVARRGTASPGHRRLRPMRSSDVRRPNEYPVYCCRADKDQTATSLCQEVRAGRWTI